jgi:hypothetical protein
MSFKLLFISGTLEQKKSGVADYIINLSKQLLSLGVTCRCISINDPFIEYVKNSAILYSNVDGIDCVRLSSHTPWSTRANLLHKLVKNFDPNWISLQYVPYAFNTKGIPFRLSHCLRTVQNYGQWEIMCHELWLESTQFKGQLLAKIQKFLTLRLFNQINPKVIHTSNTWYQNKLADSNVNCSILPLFSSIPFCQTLKPHQVTDSTWTFVLFGSINRDWDPMPLLSKIEEARSQNQIKRCIFASIGNITPHGEIVWNSLRAHNYPYFDFIKLGELSYQLVSEQLQLADFGITVAPSHLLDKSSSVAAMLSHGLPVIVSRLSANHTKWNQILKESGRYVLLDSEFNASLKSITKSRPYDTLATTASQFLESLNIFV